MISATQYFADTAPMLSAAMLLILVIFCFILLRARGRIAWLEEEADRVRDEKHALELELAALRAAQGERLSSFEQMKAELEFSRDRLKSEFELLASEVLRQREQHFQSSNRESMTLLLQPLREQLQAFQQRVNQVHDESLKGNVSLNSEVRRLAEVGLQMSREAENLARALKGDKKVTGNWGEVQLERSLELAGLERGVHYEAQARFRTDDGEQRIPDFVLKLPDGKHVVLDSKVSLVAYDKAVAAESPEVLRAALDDHVRAVRHHMDDLGGKNYSGLPGMQSPNFVLMFMPIEAAYIEALRHDSQLFDYGCRKNVILVSHSTLMPVLKTVSNLWMIAQSNEQAQLLADRAGEIYNQVALVAERLKKLGEGLDAVSRQYNSTVTAVAGQQGLHGKVTRFKELSAKANRRMPDLQPLAADIENERLGLIGGTAD